jgi:hypothetical protein
MRPNSAMACANRVGLSPTCRVRMMPVAGTRPCRSEPLSLSISSQWGAMHSSFEPVLRNYIELAVVGPRIDALEARATNVGQARREAVSSPDRQR